MQEEKQTASFTEYVGWQAECSAPQVQVPGVTGAMHKEGLMHGFRIIQSHPRWRNNAATCPGTWKISVTGWKRLGEPRQLRYNSFLHAERKKKKMLDDKQWAKDQFIFAEFLVLP